MWSKCFRNDISYKVLPENVSVEQNLELGHVVLDVWSCATFAEWTSEKQNNNILLNLKSANRP